MQKTVAVFGERSSKFLYTARRRIQRRVRHVICMIRCISDWLMNRSERSLASSPGCVFGNCARARPTTHSNLIVHSVARVVRVEDPFCAATCEIGEIFRGRSRYKFRSGRFRNKHKAAVRTKDDRMSSFRSLDGIAIRKARKPLSREDAFAGAKRIKEPRGRYNVIY